MAFGFRRAEGISFLGILFLALLGSAAAGSPPPEPSVIDLAGPWRFHQDQDGKGFEAGWSRPECDDSGWQQLRVPGYWDTQGFPGYLGKAWYRRSVTVPASWQGQPLFLRLPPIDESDRTYWNGKKIGGEKNAFQKPRVYTVPAEAVKWGESNTIAVEVSNVFGNGGFDPTGKAQLLKPGPFLPETVALPALRDAELLDLEATDHLAEKLESKKNWTTGCHDPGTSDTRPGLRALPGSGDGHDVLGFNVRYPNALIEYVDYRLPGKLGGAVWKARGYDYLRFDYQTDDLWGEMRINLHSGDFKWGGGGGWWSTFYVKPGEWTTVILPFSEFAKKTANSITFLPDTGRISIISLGYGNHCLRNPGEIRFRNFAVGRFSAGCREILPLDGPWKFSTDPDDAGLKAGWAEPAFDDAAWSPILPGRSWETQGHFKYDGIGWYRQQAYIPPDWKGLPVRLRLGRVMDSFNHAEAFLNGRPVGSTGKADKKLDFFVPADALKPGELNTLAVRVVDNKTQGGGLLREPFLMELSPVWVELRHPGEAPVEPAAFDPGPLPGKPIDLIFRVPRACLPQGKGLQLAYEVTDCFFRLIAEGRAPLESAGTAPYLQAVVSLKPEQARRLYFSETFDCRVQVHAAAGEVILSGTQRNVTLSYAERDAHPLPPLPETWEDTPYGRLQLVDTVDAAQDPATEGHPYKEGGVRASWVGRRAYATWEQGIRIGEFQGRRYREATNNEWFGYRLGRGEIQPGEAYLVRIEYPEDKTRYCPINVDAGRNYQGLGFKTGVSSGNPYDDYPLSGRFENYDILVLPDAMTYGSRGSRSAPARHGFWIFFYDNGRAYTPQYAAGPAVSRIRVYKIPDLAAAAPKIRLPEGLPQRLFIADWEREPEAIAADVVQHARFSGYNALAPSILKWGSYAFWHVKGLPFDPTKPVRDPLPPDERSAYERYLEATKAASMKLFPRLEFGGSRDIPQEERAIAANGKLAKPNRFFPWCADLLQPVVLKEFSVLLQEIIGNFIGDNPQLAGILFRIRSDRLPISYSRYDVELFAKETGAKPPPGADDTALAKWASSGATRSAYETWWHEKRRDFHRALVAELKRYRPDLKLLYYNWDADSWKPGAYTMRPEDYTDLYNVDTSIKVYQRDLEHRARFTPESYAKLMREGGKPDHKVRPELYAEVADFALLGPLNWKYLADNPDYLPYFRTGDQLAVSKIFNYEEKGRWNVQGDTYESSEMSTAGPDFAMAEQVFAVFHGDPWILTETTYTYGQGFLDTHRRFAQAFLSLPALPATAVENPTGKAEPDLRVRTYATPKGTYVSVAHKAYEGAGFSLALPGPWKGEETVTDLVTGGKVPAEVQDGKLCFDVHAPAMSLQSYLIQ